MELTNMNARRGHYIGQVRRAFSRKWRTVTDECNSDACAMAMAVYAMGPDDTRARVIWVSDTGLYCDSIAMEARRYRSKIFKPKEKNNA